jgi:alanine racemase
MEDAVRSEVEEQVGSVEAARQLCALKAAGHKVRAHLALNAMGMSRDGLEIATAQGREACLSILHLLAGNIVGICTHFPCNIPENLRETADLFQQQVSWIFANSTLERRDVLVHAGSSLTLVSDQRIETDMYRCGAILYGVLKPDLGFRTTMDLKARVISIGDYPKGATVGYDQAFRLTGDRRLACLSIGYANGFRRDGYDDATVMIGDRAAPVVGKISMNTVVVDATGLDDVQVGDEVTVFGGPPHTRASLAKVDKQFRTILADLYCDWGLRNQRIFC